MTNSFLEMRELTVGYNGRPVLEEFSISLATNEVLCVLGHNGAGKTTLLKSIFGLLRPNSGVLTIGGKKIEKPTPHESTRNGVSLLPEGRGVFPSLTVLENLKLGFIAAKVPSEAQEGRLSWVIDIFPDIRKFLYRPASTLSGGQKQMVSLARTLLSQPQCLLLDEPSIGLAPQLFQSMLTPIRSLQKEYGMSILLVEQNVRDALSISDRVVVMKSGRIVAEGLPEDFKDSAKLMEYY